MPENVGADEVEEELVRGPAPDAVDPVVEYYKNGIDRTLLIENLRLTYEERVRRAQRLVNSIDKVRGIARFVQG